MRLFCARHRNISNYANNTQSLHELRENRLREIAMISRKDVHRCEEMFLGVASLVQKLYLGTVRFLCDTRRFKLPEKIRIRGDITAIPIYMTREPKYNIQKDAVLLTF